MAGPYTHVWLAWQYLTECDDDPLLQDEGSYLLGATFADVIRVSLHGYGIPRAVTHPSLHEFCASVVRAASKDGTGPRTFLMGYLVHLVTDKIWHDLVYARLAEISREAVYQGPRLTFLVDRGLWLETSPRLRSHLAEAVARGADWGVMETRLATRTSAARALAGKRWAVEDWRGRIAHSIHHGPEALGLQIGDTGVITAIRANAPQFLAVIAFVAWFQRRLAADLRQVRTWFEAAAKADPGGDDLPDGVSGALRSYDSTPGVFSHGEKALARSVVDGLLGL